MPGIKGFFLLFMLLGATCLRAEVWAQVTEQGGWQHQAENVNCIELLLLLMCFNRLLSAILYMQVPAVLQSVTIVVML